MAGDCRTEEIEGGAGSWAEIPDEPRDQSEDRRDLIRGRARQFQAGFVCASSRRLPVHLMKHPKYRQCF